MNATKIEIELLQNIIYHSSYHSLTSVRDAKKRLFMLLNGDAK